MVWNFSMNENQIKLFCIVTGLEYDGQIFQSKSKPRRFLCCCSKCGNLRFSNRKWNITKYDVCKTCCNISKISDRRFSCPCGRVTRYLENNDVERNPKYCAWCGRKFSSKPDNLFVIR